MRNLILLLFVTTFGFSQNLLAAASRARQCSDAAFTNEAFLQVTNARHAEWLGKLQNLFGKGVAAADQPSFDAIHFAYQNFSKEQKAQAKALLKESYFETTMRKYDRHRGMYDLKRLLDHLATRVYDPAIYFKNETLKGKKPLEIYQKYFAELQQNLGLPKTYESGQVLEAIKWFQQELKTEAVKNPQAKKWKFFTYGSAIMGKGILPFSDIDFAMPLSVSAKNFISSYKMHPTIKEKFGFDHLAVNKATKETDLVIPATLNPIFFVVTADSINIRIFPAIVYADAMIKNFENSDYYRVNLNDLK